jgi:hypothetical protein
MTHHRADVPTGTRLTKPAGATPLSQLVEGTVPTSTAPGSPFRGSGAIVGGVSSRRRSLYPLVLVAAGLALEAVLLAEAARQGDLGVDFEQTLLPAAKLVAAGASPYPAYGYPPLVAFALAPLAVLPSPTVLFTLLLLACVPASLWLLGVRDLRCYGIALLWAPVFSAVQTGNVTLLLLLAASACWYWRDRARRAAVAGGLAVAAKILCWPLLPWLAATGRLRAAVGAAAVAGGVTFGLWALLGFDGLSTYPDSLRGLGDRVAQGSYTVKALLIDLGAGERSAGLAGTLVAVAAVVGVVWLGRRGDDRRSYSLAVVAMIVASPIVWLHSFALLLAPVALARPRLHWVWLAPLPLVLASGDGNGAPWQTALVLGVAALVTVVSVAPSRGWPRQALGRESTTTSPSR